MAVSGCSCSVSAAELPVVSGCAASASGAPIEKAIAMASAAAVHRTLQRVPWAENLFQNAFFMLRSCASKP